MSKRGTTSTPFVLNLSLVALMATPFLLGAVTPRLRLFFSGFLRYFVSRAPTPNPHPEAGESRSLSLTITTPDRLFAANRTLLTWLRLILTVKLPGRLGSEWLSRLDANHAYGLFFGFSLTLNCDFFRHEFLAAYGDFVSHEGH